MSHTEPAARGAFDSLQVHSSRHSIESLALGVHLDSARTSTSGSRKSRTDGTVAKGAV